MSEFGDPITEKEVSKAKTINYIALAVLILLLGTTFYFFLQLEAKQKELESKTQELAASQANLHRIRTELESAQLQIKATSTTTLQTLRSLTNKIQTGQYDAAKEMSHTVDDVVKADSTLNTVVNFYTYDIDPKVRSQLSTYLREQTIFLNVDDALLARMSWLATTPTIFYSPERAKAEAERLAKGLSERSGETFTLQAGDPQDFPKQGGSNWINVHYPNPEPSRLAR